VNLKQETSPSSQTVSLHRRPVTVHTCHTVVVGSGAASLNAADTLHRMGQTDIALVTDGMNRGTSRNTGSDKQTYYKQSTSFTDADSPLKMARTLFNGGAMHGDIALVEAALSLKSFYNLVGIGVPFPHDTYGQYVGYQTDHDENSRASSVGPLTSRYMTEKLEAQVRRNGTPLFDRHLVIGIVTTPGEKGDPTATGLLTLNMEAIDDAGYGLTLFNCRNIIYGTGGPASLYHRSVFPKSQAGATGIALEAGAKAHNLTEWQYGIASTKFRWNLSGTYQQVIPRYVSTDTKGSDEREFLEDFFQEPTPLLDAIFLKGYQWPFDSRKLLENGSSLVDLLIYIETQVKGRRVFMDFQHNPRCADEQGTLNFDLLGETARQYLANSQALLPTPIERLKKMNPLAIDLYRTHGIDLEQEYLEIDVCAQHQNGGLAGNHWWESNVKHFFPVGEANGTLGIYRPGGSALNATQVGSYRAAEYICHRYTQPPAATDTFLTQAEGLVQHRLRLIETLVIDPARPSNVLAFQQELQRQMSRSGAFIRSRQSLTETLYHFQNELARFPDQIHICHLKELPSVFRVYDMLIAQIACLSAMVAYDERQGDSRGSYLIDHEEGTHRISHQGMHFAFSLDRDFRDQVCETFVKLDPETGSSDAPNATAPAPVKVTHQWVKARPIPEYTTWFENVWADFREQKIFDEKRG